MSAAPRTPAGLILMHGQLLVRRHGLVRPRDLTCIHGHPITVRGRLYAVSIPCDEKLEPDWRIECGALVYVTTTHHRGALWFMDVNAEEDAEIDAKSLDIVAIMQRFHVGIPPRPGIRGRLSVGAIMPPSCARG